MPSLSDTDASRAPRWSHFRTDLGILLWASFLAAGVATLFFFAYFDPALLADDAAPARWLADRRAAYAAGFFFFWFVCTIASFLTAFMIETRPATDEDAP